MHLLEDELRERLATRDRRPFASPGDVPHNTLTSPLTNGATAPSWLRGGPDRPVHDLTFDHMKPAPSSADRMLDAAALLMVLGGIALFAFARQALTGIGAGTRDMPSGISAVAVTDFHVAQSRMGLFIVTLGVLVGVVAALRHRLRKAGS